MLGDKLTEAFGWRL